MSRKEGLGLGAGRCRKVPLKGNGLKRMVRKKQALPVAMQHGGAVLPEFIILQMIVILKVFYFSVLDIHLNYY